MLTNNMIKLFEIIDRQIILALEAEKKEEFERGQKEAQKLFERAIIDLKLIDTQQFLAICKKIQGERK